MKTLAEVAKQLRDLDAQFVNDRDNVFARMADVVEDVIEHAAEVRGYAWLDRFAKADYDNNWNEISPGAANNIAEYVIDLLDDVEGTQ